jgi:bacillithiol biosynthesis cysteine-adding enzyme BshC
VDCIATRLPYGLTREFSSLVLDYLDHKPELADFYSHPVSPEGFRQAMEFRREFPTNRGLLVERLRSMYLREPIDPAQAANIDALLDENTFTVCTAHQPNIFTGYLYYIYKTVHAIKLAEDLASRFPGKRFVPVFYIGSEDNDLEELGQFNLGGETLKWATDQKGAVGRMKVDKSFLALIARIKGQLAVEPFGPELVEMIATCYREGETIASGIFRLLNRLFATYGLIVLQPDDHDLKKQLIPVFRDDILNQNPVRLVEQIVLSLGQKYKLQVTPREINLFYLQDNFRERIIEKDGRYSADGLQTTFDRESLLAELDNHPDRFSPNVVLRGLYQETILPNIAFIGGGSEIAYWLELKALFEYYRIPFPVLVLRNSFLLVSKKQDEAIRKLGLSDNDLFMSEEAWMNRLVSQRSGDLLDLTDEQERLEQVYLDLEKKAGRVEPTLQVHVAALRKKAADRVLELGKKMLRAEKRKFEADRRQLLKIKGELYPGGKLQERVFNFLPWYAKHGPSFIENIYRYSGSMEQQFHILREV